jgi:hypothetical protein
MSQYSVAVSGNVPTNVPINFVTNAGTAVSAANVINVLGAGGTSTAGAGNTVTITATTAAMTWTDEAINFAAAANNGYFCTASITATLPGAPAQGNVVVIEVDTASAVTVLANTGQFIRLGNAISASAGNAVSSKRGDSLYLVYRSSSSTWFSVSTEGTWALT